MQFEGQEFISRMRTEQNYDKSMNVYKLEELINIHSKYIDLVDREEVHWKWRVYQEHSEKRRQPSRMSQVESIFEVAYYNTQKTQEIEERNLSQAEVNEPTQISSTPKM